jgi:hypothetical protein
MQDNANKLTGGCLCGAVRFQLTSEPSGAGWCHCRNCQLNSGSPAMAFASIAFADLVIDGDGSTLAFHASSNETQRWFCSKCGTPLWVQESLAPKTRDFSLATLDHPDAVSPEFHIYWQSRIIWDRQDDGLPRFPRSRNEGLRPVDSQ